MWVSQFWTPQFWCPQFWATETGAVVETTIYLDTLAANTFVSNGDGVYAEYCVTLAASASETRQLKYYVAGTLVFDSGANLYTSGGTADVWVTILRESSSVLRIRVEFDESGLTQQPQAPYTRLTGLTLSNTVELKLTGTTVTSSDIAGALGTVLYEAGA